MTRYILDTNIVSLILRQQPVATAHLDAYAHPGNLILACPMVWYEIRRGLLVRDAKLQMEHFEELFAKFTWQDFRRDDWSLASTLWAKRRTLGLPITDADLLIAVFTINRNAVLVTNNEKDFRALDVTVEDWTTE